MVKLVCAKCGRGIPAEDINVAKDVAYCRECNVAYALSELAQGDEPAAVNPRQPPPGAWCRQDGMGTVIGATHRSLGTAFGALVFGLFWNGIVSIFVLLAISATLHNLHIPQPNWFPAPKMNGQEMTVGMNLFLWLFLTPFITIGLVMAGTFFSCIWGRTEVRVQKDEGVIFTGVGALGWRRRFDARSVKGVSIKASTWQNENRSQQRFCIVIETREGKRLKFGSLLSEERREFVEAVVRRELVR